LHFFDCEIDTKFKSVRARETKIGNFICDLMRKFNSAHVAILNSGTLRSDIIYKPQEMTVGDWVTINPYRKDVDMVECTGEILIEILE